MIQISNSQISYYHHFTGRHQEFSWARVKIENIVHQTQIYILYSVPGCVSQSAEEDRVKDVVEGADVVLECRFSPGLSSSPGTLYWIRSSNNNHDNVAIGETPFSTGYTWVHPTPGPLIGHLQPLIGCLKIWQHLMFRDKVFQHAIYVEIQAEWTVKNRSFCSPGLLT